MRYEGALLEALSGLHWEGERHEGEGQSGRSGWFAAFCRAYVTYLVRLPSVSEVHIRAQLGEVDKESCDVLLVDVFRIVNQVGLLKDNLGIAFNTIGRYYQPQVKVYRPLFDLLWTELNSLYEYLRKAINRIFQNYQQLDGHLLRVFLSSVK